ncbi:MAG: flavodoxin-dependent (E)-4-hydroxy-3-methylbut-2-enyl-diphosphate synthase [Erysipelotrichaceae bacterium]|nr:flavodoxin-dependent (E)-4-hydroxy-3-methylbut-2-enyl-diphosphate synthase [Erysipelotrichaceae bacterium]
MTKRNETKIVRVGNLLLGGNNPILIQSMTNTKTKDVFATINQINELAKYGCDIIRVAVLDKEDALSISKIKEGINIPLVADIHFDPELAIIAIKEGVDKIRLNPGNITNKDKIKEIVSLCKERKIPIRIGVNAGSLPKDLEVNAENMIIAAKRHIEILEELDFTDIVLSLKASNIDLTVEAYKLASKTFPYPLHVGITEAGTSFKGLITSSIGLSKILEENIGNTIRVSLTDNPRYEVMAAKEILKELHLKNNVPTITSCPTCGRTQIDLIPIAKEIESYLQTINKDIHVAVMGCAVNGPGEAKEADLGIAGGIGEALIFKKGQIVRKIKEENIIEELKKEIDLF